MKEAKIHRKEFFESCLQAFFQYFCPHNLFFVKSKLLISSFLAIRLQTSPQNTKDRKRERKRNKRREKENRTRKEDTMGTSFSRDLVGYVNNHLSLLYHVSRCPYLTSVDGNLTDVIARYSTSRIVVYIIFIV